ncbi:MAG: hypothetical protein B7Y40_08330 [Gammaproteobacteria bacterium 28-57-27]|nr:MAG: hypothetical protein B7Y40_08330 [Gammaproteobacteria bacterium 28-57-27]
MMIYLAFCLVDLFVRLFPLLPHLGDPNARFLLPLLNEALFTLIVLAIVRSLFINDSFHYALTFLEVGFVVLLRKLILLDVSPEEVWVLLVLGLVSALFFTLILWTHFMRKTLTPHAP